ncbi:MAG: AsmA-like C-terminal region-containing protein, partial [Nitrospinota bacterium]
AEVAFDGTLESFDITGKADLKDGDFRYGELMKKPRGERANLTLKGRYRGGDITIEQIALAIKDLEATGRASVNNLEDPVIDLALRTNQVDLAQWSPAGKRLTGKVSLVIGVKGQLFTPEALAFTQAKLTASGIGPLETVLEALPSVRESLPKGFKMKGRADVSVSLSGSYPNLSGRAVVDLTQAGLHHPDWVVKPAGRPARLAVEGRNSGKALTVKAFEAILGKDWVRGSAHVADFDQPRGSLTVASSPMKLEQLAEALPVLKRYGLAGSVTVDINVQGDTARLKQAQAKGIVEVKELKARLPQLAAPLEKMTGTLELKGQEATLKRFVVAYGDSLISLSATARGFDAPQVAFALDAPRLVLDQWKAPKRKRPLRRPKASREPFGPASPARIVLVKAPPRPSGLFAWFKKVRASGSVRVRRAEYKDWLLENLQAKTSLRRGIFILNHLTFGLHKGRFDGGAVVDLDPASATFSFRSSLVGVDVNDLLTAHGDLPNTVWGRLDATLDIKGRGQTAAAFMPTLAGQGQATVTDGHINMAIVRDLLN